MFNHTLKWHHQVKQCCAFPARSRHHAIMHTLEHDKKQVEGNAALRYQCFYVICFISKHFARLTRQTRRQTRIKHNLLTIRTKDWSALRPLRAKCKTLGRVVFADCAELITAPSYHRLADRLTPRLRCLVPACKLPTLGPLPACPGRDIGKLKTCYFKHF